MTAELLAFVKECLCEDERLAWEWVQAAVASCDPKEPRQKGEPRKYNAGDVLSEVHSKWLMVSLYEEAVGTAAALKQGGQCTSHYEVAAESYLNVIRLLAYAYRTRDGYKDTPEWAPGWIRDHPRHQAD